MVLHIRYRRFKYRMHTKDKFKNICFIIILVQRWKTTKKMIDSNNSDIAIYEILYVQKIELFSRLKSTWIRKCYKKDQDI